MTAQGPVCDICGRPAHYRFALTLPNAALRCWRHAMVYGPVVRRALDVALIVGTIIVLVNQADVVLSGKLSAPVLLRIALAYLVPFLVTNYAALDSNRLHLPPAESVKVPIAPS
jgi:hypothetical protein